MENDQIFITWLMDKVINLTTKLADDLSKAQLEGGMSGSEAIVKQSANNAFIEDYYSCKETKKMTLTGHF